jgi:2-methylisocitrate lyase-like PEP mutase family enzyme
VLLLANCWDAGSARLLESLGARALATTSAAVAWSHGYRDGDALPIACLLATVREISRATSAPLTVDIEGGYASEPAAVGELVAALIDAGAVGINLEDGASPVALLAAKVARVKQVVARSGVDLFVNARTDVYLKGLVPGPRRVAEVLARAASYREAGADGLFVPGVVDRESIGALAAGAGVPLNVMVRPEVPPAAELATLGVRRLSAGSSLAQSVWGNAAALAAQFLREGRSEPLCAPGGMAYSDINALFHP